jgi:hypothetical protein
MKRIAKGGGQLWRSVTVRVFNVGNDGKTTRKFFANPGHGFNEEGIDNLLEKVADDLERRLPNEQYSLVQVGPASFNFVWRETRGAPGSQQQASA